MFEDYRPGLWEPGTDISLEQSEFATNLRIPFLTSAYPRWNYITGIVVGDENRWPGIVPEEEEVKAVAHVLRRYCEHWYNDGFKAAMKRLAPYDIDGGANLAYFYKNENGGWSYRKRTWTGPEWIPGFREPIETIEQVIERLRLSY